MKTATVHLDAARGAEWEAILGTREIPVQSPVPVLCRVPGCAIPQLGYVLNLGALTREQGERLAARLAERFHVSVEFAWAKILISGVAVHAEGAGVSFSPELLPTVLAAWTNARGRGHRRAA